MLTFWSTTTKIIFSLPQKASKEIKILWKHTNQQYPLIKIIINEGPNWGWKTFLRLPQISSQIIASLQHLNSTVIFDKINLHKDIPFRFYDSQELCKERLTNAFLEFLSSLRSVIRSHQNGMFLILSYKIKTQDRHSRGWHLTYPFSKQLFATWISTIKPDRPTWDNSLATVIPCFVQKRWIWNR